ncbi:ABC transporter permease [Clostridium estertheticum]|uniref:ABC transporter permease n=1 Tax=Clostridium estertheticum TaxID=238834 RepID=UPI001C0E7F89|nr:ABC transporter permease [Clostridium estertheticum]MBU3216061.1 ABC transporter permease [Clostridium estertheticum]WAG55950.1 ABC transporter permease [Clostridium estertheticum]
MNKLVCLFLLDTKLLLKSKVFYFKLVLFPIVLVLIIGSLNSSQVTLKTFNVGYYSDDSSFQSLNLSNTLRDDVFKSKDVKEVINLKSVKSYAEGKKLVSNGTYVALVYVPKNFTKNYINNSKINISVIGDNNKLDDVSIVKTILNSFDKNISIKRVEQNEVIEDMALNKSNVRSVDVNKLISNIQNTSGNSSEISKIATRKNAKPIDVMQYMIIGMVVMFSILTAFELAHSIVNDKLNNTMNRIKSTPTANFQYVFGKVIGVVFAIMVQMITVITIGGIVFRESFGNIFYILLVTAVYALTIGLIVFCAGITAKNHMEISTFATPILWGFSFLGGSLISKSNFPNSLQMIQKIIPNGKAINCYLAICEGKGIGDIYMDLVELLAIAAVFLIIALILLNKGKNNLLVKDNTSKG